MFLNMVNDLCFGYKEKAEMVNHALIRVFYKGTFEPEEFKQLASVAIVPSNELRDLLHCDFNSLLELLHKKALMSKCEKGKLKNPWSILFEQICKGLKIDKLAKFLNDILVK